MGMWSRRFLREEELAESRTLTTSFPRTMRRAQRARRTAGLPGESGALSERPLVFDNLTAFFW